MRNRTWRVKFCPGSSDGCEEGTELIWSTGRALSQTLQWMTTQARNLDREVYQDPDSDRYLIPVERVFDNAADDLETIAVSKRSISLLPQKEVVRIDL